MSLSVVMITKDCAPVLGQALESVKGLWDELLVGDSGSTDGTVDQLKRYGVTIVEQREGNLGERKQELIERAKGEWILVLDSDERVSEELKEEVLRLKADSRLRGNDSKRGGNDSKRDWGAKHVRGSDTNSDREIAGYRIPYQNYVFGRPVYYGGERYSKVRLFRKGRGRVESLPIHEEIIVDGRVADLSGVIHHHSYRRPRQLFAKFSYYAKLLALEKLKKGEEVTLRKLFFYGPHMFWARFIKEEGYKDGLRGFVLAFAFAYMEALTYWILYFL